MCQEIERLSFGFTHDPDDSDGGVFIGNSNYDRYKAIVEHIANCTRCLSEGWRSYERPPSSRPREGKLWYGNVYRDERIADQYFRLMGIDLEHGTRLPSTRGDGIGRKTGSPSDQGPDVFNGTKVEYNVAVHSGLKQLNLDNRTYHCLRRKK